MKQDITMILYGECHLYIIIVERIMFMYISDGEPMARVPQTAHD